MRWTKWLDLSLAAATLFLCAGAALAAPQNGWWWNSAESGRGFFIESFRNDVVAALPMTQEWVQDNHSRSTQGVVRGMHFQLGDGQAKLIRCARGAICDVVVDLRPDSGTFAEWEAFVLDDENLHELYVPVGFAHGFCVISDLADVVYKCSSYYDPSSERGFAYNDPEVAIEWPAGLALSASQRDSRAPLLKEIKSELAFNY